MSEPVLYEVAGGVATVTLNRPEQLNAFTAAMQSKLAACIDAAGRDPDVRCVVITGAGRAFCAGEDLRAATSGAALDFEDILLQRYQPIILGLQALEKPVIAAVNGVAAGAGVSLACACDIRLASDQASFIQAFVNIGLIPDAGANYLLPRLIGYGRALELALTGEKVTAAAAQAMGLVNRVYPHAEFASAVRTYAERLATGATRAMGLAKRAAQFGQSQTLAETLREEAKLQQQAGQTADHAEGVAAFLAKRPAVFRGA